MLWVADATLAAAVSNAGALGVISPLAGMPRDGDPVKNLIAQIQNTRQNTPYPFGVNIPLDLGYSGLLIDAVLRENVGIVITAAGDPSRYTELLGASGVVVLHVVGSVKQATHAQACGVRAVIASGYEAAGHLARNAMPLMTLIPQVVDSVSIPVIAAGGICDGRGIAAALSLGAEGVQLGTRFVATDECPAHINYKQALIAASDTVVTSVNRRPSRALRTAFTEKLIELESSGASVARIEAFIGFRKSHSSQLEGDLSGGECFAGASVGLIHKVMPVKKVIERLIADYHETLLRIKAFEL